MFIAKEKKTFPEKREIQKTMREKEAKKKERKVGKKQLRPSIRSRPNFRLMKAEAVKNSLWF